MNGAEAAAVADAFAPRVDIAGLFGPDLSLETLITSTDLAAFSGSPPQVALIRALEGKAIDGILTPTQTLFHFGTDIVVPRKPRIVYLRTGVRAGKSLISAMAGLLWSSLVCDMSGVRKGELVRAPIVSAKLATSRSAFNHLVGTMQASRLLAPLIVGKPNAESMTIRRPDGFDILFELLAASPGGTNLRSTWLSGCVLDEADFFDADGKQANLGDQVKATTTRLLPNAQLYMPSSPWAAEGYWYKNFEAAFGSPGRELAFHSDTCSMNTSPTMAEDVEAERKKDPHNARREYDAIPLDIDSAAFFPETALEVAIAKGRGELSPNGLPHYAGCDLGFRKNSSTLAFARVEGARVRFAMYRELIPPPGRPLVPSEVIVSFADEAKSYSTHSIMGDLYYADTAHDELAKWSKANAYVITYDEQQPTQTFKAEWFTRVRTLMAEGKCELPDDPRLLTQFRGVKSRPLPGGVIQIQLPKQGQSHGDILFAAVLAICQAADTFEKEPPPQAPKAQTYRSQMD